MSAVAAERESIPTTKTEAEGRDGEASAAAPIYHVQVENYIRLARWMAYKFVKFRVLSRRELTSEAMLALMLAASRFNPDKGFAFTTFATKTIHGHLCNEIKRELRIRGQDTLPGGWPVRFDEIVCLKTPSACWVVDRDDEREYVRWVIGCMPHRLGKVLSLRYGIGNGVERSQREVSEIVGVSRERTRQLIVKAEEEFARLMGR